MAIEVLNEVVAPASLLAILLGVLVGIVVGALPGLGSAMVVALLLPFTFSMDLVPAILLLLGCYAGSVYGGGISAVLIGAPGTAASAATVADGYGMAKKGLARRALTLCLLASVVGSFLSGIGLLIGAPLISTIALQFSSPEFFLLALGGLILVAGVEGGSFLRGLMAAALGVLITTIGVDTISGSARFDFGQVEMMSGIDFIPVIIGLFAFAEVLRQLDDHRGPRIEVTTSRKADGAEAASNSSGDIGAASFIRTSSRSGLIGFLMGIVPGVGPTVSAYMAYARAKVVSKKPEEFGTGSEEGVVAAESANNGTTVASMLPLLTLGIPGDAVTAVLLGAFLVQGLTPGPMLMEEAPVLVYSIIAGVFLVTIALLGLGRLLLPLFSRIATVPKPVLMPIVLLLCVLGTFALKNSYFDVLVMVIFGVFGYLMPKVGLPVTPMLLGVVLGGMIESEFRRALLMSDGGASIFVTQPISLVILVVLCVFTGWKVLRTASRRTKLPARSQETA